MGRARSISSPEAQPGYWEHLGYDRDAWVGRSNGYHVVKLGHARFSRTERTLHWVNAAGFFLLLATGLDPLSAAAVGRSSAGGR